MYASYVRERDQAFQAEADKQYEELDAKLDAKKRREIALETYFEEKDRQCKAMEAAAPRVQVVVNVDEDESLCKFGCFSGLGIANVL